MKTLLSCDQIFETLTRGPFPSGAPDDDMVEQHLTACHECRCLAEALRPASTLFHESLSAVEQEQLPAYDGLLARLTTEAVATTPSKPSATGANLAQAVRLGSAFLLAVSLVLLLVLASGGLPGLSAQPRQQFAALPGVRTVYRPNNDRLLALASQRLPAVCFPADWAPAADVSASGATELACCSQCHAPGAAARNACAGKWNHSCRQCHASATSQAAGPRLFAVLQQSCLACHDS